ncbi:MAG TPA: hypothetical protein VGR02_06060 [Thermoanaerobaculia bacterium]|jgi:hypothetical protein|nr:hypothetical protein [Thermoanaerobaculia bacterium]
MNGTSREERDYTALLLLTAIGFLIVVLALSIQFGWAMPPAFRALAFMPALIGIGNYIVAQRRTQDSQELRLLQDACNREKTPSQQRLPIHYSIAASSLLAAVFVIVAFSDPLKLPGLVYAGYGAYVSTLWSMLVRMNCNALSPRFLVNSAVKAASAMILGQVAAEVSGLGMGDSHLAAQAVFFLIGLFQPMAIKRLRTTAVTTFGVVSTGAADLPVGMLEGVDDGAADILEEMGITSVQHLATTPADEVCVRTFYSPNRVLDWIDQAILTIHTNGRIEDLRRIGIRTARALDFLETNKASEAMRDRLKQAAQALGLPEAALPALIACIRRDPAFQVLLSHDVICKASAHVHTPAGPDESTADFGPPMTIRSTPAEDSQRPSPS